MKTSRKTILASLFSATLLAGCADTVEPETQKVASRFLKENGYKNPKLEPGSLLSCGKHTEPVKFSAEKDGKTENGTVCVTYWLGHENGPKSVKFGS